DGHKVAGIDLGLVFLRPARPHRSLDASLPFEGAERSFDALVLGRVAHADRLKLTGWHPERHLVFLKVDHEKLKSCASYLLLFDTHNAAHAMRRIDNILVGTKTVSLLWLLLVGHYSHLTLVN